MAINMDKYNFPSAEEYREQAEGVWLPFFTELDTSFDAAGRQLHKYIKGHTEEVAQILEEGVTISTTQARDKIQGVVKDITSLTSQELKKLGQQFERTSEEQANLRVNTAGKRGTAVHKVMELIENDRELTVEKIQEQLKTRAIDKEVLQIFDDFLSPDKLRKAQQMKQVFDSVTKILQLKTAMGVQDVKFSELGLGATTIKNGKRINISGSLDQVLDGIVNDFKTGSKVGIEEALQQVIYQALTSINVGAIPGLTKLNQVYATHVNPYRKAELLQLTGSDEVKQQQVLDMAAEAIEGARITQKQINALGLKWEAVAHAPVISDKSFYKGTEAKTYTIINKAGERETKTIEAGQMPSYSMGQSTEGWRNEVKEFQEYENMFWETYGPKMRNASEGKLSEDELQELRKALNNFILELNRSRTFNGQALESDWWIQNAGTISQITKGRDLTGFQRLQGIMPSLQKVEGTAINDKFIGSYFSSDAGLEELKKMAQEYPQVLELVARNVKWYINFFDNLRIKNPDAITEEMKVTQARREQFGRELAPQVFDEMTEVEAEEFRQSMEAGWGASYDRHDQEARHSRLKAIDRDYFYQPEVWEKAQEQEEAWERDGTTPRDQRSTAESLEQTYTMTANRIGRIVDFSQRVDNIMARVAKNIGYEGDSSQLAASYLAQNSPQMYARYQRSKEWRSMLGGRFGRGTSGEGDFEGILHFIQQNLDVHSAEENQVAGMLGELLHQNEGHLPSEFEKVFKKRMGFTLYPRNNRFMAPEVLEQLDFANPDEANYEGLDASQRIEKRQQILASRKIGQEEGPEWLEQFRRQYAVDKAGGVPSFDIDNIYSEQAERIRATELSPLDFYESKLKEQSEELGVTTRQIEIFIGWLKELDKFADQAGEDLERLISELNLSANQDTPASQILNPKGRIVHNLQDVGLSAYDVPLLPLKGRNSLSKKARTTLFSAIGYDNSNAPINGLELNDSRDTDNLSNQYSLYQNEIAHSIEEAEEATRQALMQEIAQFKEHLAAVPEAIIRLMNKDTKAAVSTLGSDIELEGTVEKEISNIEETAEAVTEEIIEETAKKVKKKAISRSNKNKKSEKTSGHILIDGEGDLPNNAKMTGYAAGVNGEVALTFYKAQIEKAFADYGKYRDRVGFIAAKKAGAQDDTAQEETRRELTRILSQIEGYKKSSGALNANGKKALEETIEEIYGKKPVEELKIVANHTDFESKQTSAQMPNSTVEIPNAVINASNPVINTETSYINTSGNIIINGSTISGGSGERGGSNGGHNGGSGQGGSNNKQDSNENLAEYLALLQKIHQLKIDIYKLEVQGEAEIRKSNSIQADSLKQRAKELEIVKATFEEQARFIETTSEFNDKEKKRISDQNARNRVSYDAAIGAYDSSFTLENQKKNETELEALLKKRLGYEQQIASEQKTINTSFSGMEKESLREVISMQEQEVGLLDEKIKKLIKSGDLRKEELGQILRQYQISQNLAKANAASKDHGAMSLFDKMKYDVQRSVTRVLDYGISAKVLNTIPRGLQKIYQLTIQLEDAITNLRVVTGMNRKEAEATMITYQKLGRELGATTQEVAQSATTWLRQGYAVEEAGNLIDASMKLSKLGFMQADQATQVLTASLKGFKLEVGNAMDVVDKLTTMDQKAAVSAQGVSEALSLMANSARLAGLDINQAIAMVSTVGEVTQQSMGTVGNAMKTMLARFGNVKAGTFSAMGEDGEETSANINDIEKVLGKLGIRIRSASGEMREFDDVLQDVTSQWGTLDTVSKNAIAGALGGVRQREAVVTLLENYERYQELVEESANAAGSANKKYEAYTDSSEAKLKELTNAWEKFTQKVGASPIIKFGTETLTFFIDNMGTLISLVATLGGRFAAMKAPTWLANFFGKNFGGGKVSSFIGNLVGGNDGVVGSIINNRRQKKINNKYDAQITNYDDQLKALDDAELNAETHAEELAVQQKREQLVELKKKAEEDRKTDLENSQWVKDPKEKETKGTEKTNSLLQEILDFLKQSYGPENSERAQADLEAAQATRERTEADQANTAASEQNTNSEYREAGASDASAQSEYQEVQANQASAASEGGGQGGGLLAKLTGKTGQKILGAAGAGVMGAISGFTSTASVGDTGLQKFYNTTGQTAEADMGDKLIKGVAQGGLAALGTAFLGPLGGILGNLIGGGIADLISYLRHKDELERKQRVEEAKERLEAIKSAKESLDNFSSTITSYALTGEEYQKAKEAVDKFSETLWADSALAEKFQETLKTVDKELGELSFGELTDKMLNGTPEEKQEIAQAMDLTLARQQRQETEASLEQDMYDNKKAMETGVADKGSGDINRGISAVKGSESYNALVNAASAGTVSNLQYNYDNSGNVTGISGLSLAGTTAEERAANAKEVLGDLAEQGVVTGGLVENLEKVVEKYDEIAASQNKINRELATLDVNIGFIASGVSNLSKAEQQAITYEGAIQMVADAMEREGLEVRNTAGIIKDDYLPLIESAIKSDTNLTELVRGETITYGSLADAQERMASALSKLQKIDGNITWKSLKNLNDYATSENIAKLDEYAVELGITRDQLRGLIEQSGPERIQGFANALGVTLETLQSWGPGLETLSQSFVLELSPEKVREAKEGYQSLYDDIITTGKMSAENMEKIISDYPDLIPYLGDEKALRQEIGKILGPDGALNKAYKQSMFMSLQSSESFFKKFKKNVFTLDGKETTISDVMESFFDGMDDSVQKDELVKAWGNATTLEQAFEVLQSDLIEEGSETAEKVQAALTEMFDFTMKIQQDTSEWDRVIEYQTSLLDEQIDNLQKQKDALSAFNDERKKELDLIKAQKALENAKKEKKMVFREGKMMPSIKITVSVKKQRCLRPR